MLGISDLGLVLTVAPKPNPDRRERDSIKEQTMLNLVEKYSEEAAAESEDGVVAIEYVVMAGLVAIGVALTFGTSLWADMKAKLDALF